MERTVIALIFTLALLAGVIFYRFIYPSEKANGRGLYCRSLHFSLACYIR